MDLWNKVKESIIERRGDISGIEIIPEHVRNVYKTSFTNSPYAYIEVAARAQKWFDQAISRNIYLETRDIDQTMDIYTAAWEKGLKSTYYLHMKPRHSAEQSTIRVNKAEAMGKKGFGAIAELEKTESFKKPVTEPVESGEAITVSPPKEVAAVKKEAAEEKLMENENGDEMNIHVPEDPGDSLVCDSCQ